MDIRNGIDEFKLQLGVAPTNTPLPETVQLPSAKPKPQAEPSPPASIPDEIVQAFSKSGVRVKKVAEVRAAIKAGTYDVPARAVASKLVDAMLDGN